MNDMAKDDKGAGKGGSGVAVEGADRDHQKNVMFTFFVLFVLLFVKVQDL
jgi:hypothetical protein